MALSHRLTDFDYAVLAAAKIGALRRSSTCGPRGRPTAVWFLAGVNVMPSLHRLQQAGELHITRSQTIIFPDTEEWADAEDRAELYTVLRRGIRDGSIKVTFVKPKKGTKP